MRLSSKVLISVFPVLAIATGGSAFAEDLFSFTYSDLDGDYDAGSMLFTAADDDLTDGDVTRIISPTGTAFFFRINYRRRFSRFRIVQPRDDAREHYRNHGELGSRRRIP